MILIIIRFGYILHEIMEHDVDIKINNNNIVIENYTPDFSKKLKDLLSYTDKSKEYQIRKMSRNPFSRSSALYKKLVADMHGNLVDEQSSVITIPSGFAYLFKNNSIIDNRKDTGKKVAFPWKTKPYEMRDYQLKASTLMGCNYRGLINLATGLGKTLTAIHTIRSIGRRTLVLCPTQSIADNFYQELRSAFGDDRVGYFGGGKKQLKDITVGIAASVNNHIDKFAKHELGLIIIDEVHHVPADTFFTIAKTLSSVGRMFGLTATDFRSDGKDVMISAGVGEVLIRCDIVWGIQNKWLAVPKFVIREVDTGGKDFKDDKLKSYKEHVLNNDVMKNQIKNDARKVLKAGKQLLILVDEVAQGEELSKELGLPLAQGKDPKSSEYVRQLNSGEIPGLIGTDGKISEGTDTKNVDVLILANFIASKGPVLQCLGRALRKQGKKTSALILDYIPTGSSMLTRHAKKRITFYQEITDDVTIV